MFRVVTVWGGGKSAGTRVEIFLCLLFFGYICTSDVFELHQNQKSTSRQSSRFVCLFTFWKKGLAIQPDSLVFAPLYHMHDVGVTASARAVAENAVCNKHSDFQRSRHMPTVCRCWMGRPIAVRENRVSR